MQLKGSLVKAFALVSTAAILAASPLKAQEKKTVTLPGNTRVVNVDTTVGAQSDTFVLEQSKFVQDKPWASDPNYQRELKNIQTAYELDLEQLHQKEEAAHLRVDGRQTASGRNARNATISNAKRTGKVFENKKSSVLDKIGAVITSGESANNQARVNKQYKLLHEQITAQYDEYESKLLETANKRVIALDAKYQKADLKQEAAANKAADVAQKNASKPDAMNDFVKKQKEAAYKQYASKEIKAGRDPKGFDDWNDSLKRANNNPAPKR